MELRSLNVFSVKHVFKLVYLLLQTTYKKSRDRNVNVKNVIQLKQCSVIT